MAETLQRRILHGENDLAMTDETRITFADLCLTRSRDSNRAAMFEYSNLLVSTYSRTGILNPLR
jgi:hypothetical protein